MTPAQVLDFLGIIFFHRAELIEHQFGSLILYEQAPAFVLYINGTIKC